MILPMIPPGLPQYIIRSHEDSFCVCDRFVFWDGQPLTNTTVSAKHLLYCSTENSSISEMARGYSTFSFSMNYPFNLLPDSQRAPLSIGSSPAQTLSPADEDEEIMRASGEVIMNLFLCSLRDSGVCRASSARQYISAENSDRANQPKTSDTQLETCTAAFI